MKRATNIHPMTWNCSKGCQGQRSEVKVICVQMGKFYSSGVIHFAVVASNFTCFFWFIKLYSAFVLPKFLLAIWSYTTFRMKMPRNTLIGEWISRIIRSNVELCEYRNIMFSGIKSYI